MENLPTAAPQPAAPTPVGPTTHWRQMFAFAGLATAFWLLQFLAQYFWLTEQDIKASQLRSFALTGATLIGLALFSSALFKWVPRWAKHWRTRRHLGVAGTIFIILHVGSALRFFYNFELSSVFYSFNPLENPVVFGAIAYPIFLLMALTSTDWAMRKLGKWWKFIHRFVYLAYWGAIFHFITINPELLKNPPGYLLLGITGFAVFGQVFWYVRTVRQRGFHRLGTWVGAGLILLFATTGYLVYRHQNPPEIPLGQSVEKMEAFMQTQPTDSTLQTKPIAEDQAFTATMLRQGTFQDLHYTTDGTARLEQTAANSFAVVLAENFTTPNGPDLRVYLTRNSGPTEREDITAGVYLGKLKSTMGKQVYALPAGVAAADFNSVTIHCKAFNVPWSYAPFE